MKDWGKQVFRLLLLITALAVGTGVAAEAASAKSIYKKGASLYQKGKYVKAQRYFKKLGKNAEENCIKKMSPAMKKAYLKVLKSYSPDRAPSIYYKWDYVWGYYLTDIDKDGKADMVIQYGSCEADVRAYVYTYKHGKIKSLGDFPCAHSMFYYDPRGNGMTVANAHMMGENIYTVKLRSGKLQRSFWRKKTRMLASGENYLSLPYQLDDHIRWSTNSKRTVNYKPLK